MGGKVSLKPKGKKKEFGFKQKFGGGKGEN